MIFTMVLKPYWYFGIGPPTFLVGDFLPKSYYFIHAPSGPTLYPSGVVVLLNIAPEASQ